MKRKTVLFVLIVVLVFVVVSTALFSYNTNVQDSLAESTFQSVGEVLVQQRQSFVSHIDSAVREAGFAADTINIFDEKDNSYVVSVLSSIVDKSIFSKAALADTNGRSVNNSGTVVNMFGRQYFHEALDGNVFISDPFISAVDLKRYIVVSTPIRKNEEIAAVFVAFINLDDMTFIMHPSFSGYGTSYIMTTKGNIVAKSSNTIMDFDRNLLEVMDGMGVRDKDTPEVITENLAAQRGGMSDYYFDGQRRLLIYEPVGIKDWYILSILDYRYISTQASQLMTETMILTSVILIIFLCVLLFLLRSNKRLRQSDARLKQAEAYNRLILDSLPIASCLWSEELECITINRAFREMYQLKSNELIASEFFVSHSPEFQPDGRVSGETAIALLRETFEKGYMDFEWMHTDSNGKKFPARVTLVRNKYRSKYFISAFVEDLTEKKAMAASAKAAEEYSNLLLEGLPLACNIRNADSAVAYCNNRLLALFGLKSVEEYVNKYDLCSPEFQPNGCRSTEMNAENVEKVREKGQIQFEWTHRNVLTGELLPCEKTLVVVPYGDSKVIAGYIRDLRRQKAAEAALSEMDAYNRLILDSMPLACMLWSKDAQLIYCNNPALYLFEVENQETMAKEFFTLSPEYQQNGRKSAELSRELIHGAAENGTLQFDWVHITMRTKEQIPCRVTLERAIFKGQYIVISYVTDMRETKAMMAEMEARKKMEAARDEAERGGKAKLQFLAKMSHEIRTPMNAIMGMSALLMESDLDRKQMAYSRDIQISAETLLGIINDILDFSKLDSGKMDLVCRDFNFYTFLDNIRSVAQHIVTSKNLAFGFDCEGEIPEFLYGDPTRLRQVLWNVIGNASKYTQKGSVHVTVRASEDKLYFDVEDTGIGIMQEDIPKLFDAFSQFNQEKNIGIVGTGLGLSIANGYVKMMGGSIAVKSVYGEGSVFTIVVPKVIGGALAAEEAVEEAARIISSTAKVLVVDDNEINLHVAEGLFSLLGINIDTAASGFESIAMLKEKKYDIVFMDHMMPGMDGVEATRAIREMGGYYEEIPIIALTANAMKGVKEMLIEEGMDDFLSKPIIKEELNVMLIRWLPKDMLRLGKAAEDHVEAEEETEDEPLKRQIENEIEEIDVNVGIRRAGGNWNAYRSALELYSRRSGDYIKELNRYLKAHDMANYAIAVHALKGVLATFGAMRLASFAADSETAAKADDEDFCRNSQPTFVAELTEFNEKVAALFEEDEGDADKPDCPPGLLEKNLEEIGDAIDGFDDSRALSLLDELLSYAQGEATKNALLKVRHALQEFDFDKAMQCLTAAQSM